MIITPSSSSPPKNNNKNLINNLTEEDEENDLKRLTPEFSTEQRPLKNKKNSINTILRKGSFCEGLLDIENNSLTTNEQQQNNRRRSRSLCGQQLKADCHVC